MPFFEATKAAWQNWSLRATPNVPQPVFASLHYKFAEFLFGLSRGRRLEGHPFDRLAPGVVFNADPGDEFAVAPPEAANCLLAIVQNLGVSVSS